MCDKDHFVALEERVDSLEKKVVVMESTQVAMRGEMKEGFTSIHQQLSQIYAERAAWSQWMRENLPKVGKWLGKWSIILIGVAIGVNNLPTIVRVFGGVVK